MFFKELETLLGLNRVLNQIHFGNIIDISGGEVELNLFKNDFIFFMTCLYNNINFDDYKDPEFMWCYEKFDYCSPMDLKVFFDNLKVNFQYSFQNKENKSFLTFLLPNFGVLMKKTKINSKNIEIFCDSI